MKTPDMKIIMCSGYDDFEYAKAAMRIGVMEYLLKPVTHEEVTGAVKSATEAICQEKVKNKIKHKGETIMRTKQFKTALSRILCTVLIVAMALFTIGCGQQNSADDSSAKTTITQVYEDGTVIGEGETEFTFIVTDKDGNSKKFTVKTDSETVGEALQAVEIIHGDMGDYGLYVKEVNGIVADYDVDGTYWAFYIDGEYAMSGVDTTDVVAGANYELKVEK